MVVLFSSLSILCIPWDRSCSLGRWCALLKGSWSLSSQSEFLVTFLDGNLFSISELVCVEGLCSAHFGALVCSMTIIAIWSVFMGDVTFCEFLVCFLITPFLRFLFGELSRNLSS